MQSLNAELRKYQNHMLLSGKGVILLGIWGIFKLFFLQILLDHGLDKAINNTDLDELEITLAKIVFLIVFGIICLIILILHFYIGRNAIKYSKGQKHSNLFIMITAIYAIIYIISLPYYFTEQPKDTLIDTSFAALLIDITSLFILFDIINSFAKIRKLVRQINEMKVEQV